ncbi:MAG: cold shock domain-containing protein [Planctomycetes bacterium]|nr:cold shock domain-containing protein [Planctomycetota bacterium]
MRHGTVKWWSGEKGYGFILSDDGVEVFFHGAYVAEETREAPVRAGQQVVFQMVQGLRGPAAQEVKCLN